MVVRRAEISPLAQVMQRVDAIADGATHDSISTGFPSLDRLLGGGVRRGDLIVLGGDVGSGKSAFALALALRVSQDDRLVSFRSGEMSVERVLERALAVEGRARIDDMRRGLLDDSARAGVGAAAVRLRDQSPIFETVPAGGVEPLADMLRRTLDVHLVVVDPLQSLAPGVRDQAEELAAVTRQLKLVALELVVAILATSSLPGLVADRRDLRPQLDDFGALGAIKQYADVVLGLFREEMYGSSHGVEGATEMSALKNRNGPTGYVDLYFYKQWMRFEDMLDPDR